MSVVAYGAITRKREEAPIGTSDTTNPPGIKTYLDALAALVPAEILIAHGIVIGNFTEIEGDVTTITNPEVLSGFFWFFLILCPILFLVGLQKVPKAWDWARMVIPAAAFIGWTMLQPATVFDGIQEWVKSLIPWFSADWRWAYGLMIAILVGLVAGLLGLEADRRANANGNNPPPQPPV